VVEKSGKVMEKFEGDVVLKDGSLAHVRRSTGDDRPLLLEFLQGLSERTLTSRFLEGEGDQDRTSEPWRRSCFG
jgi:hypothetical protein